MRTKKHQHSGRSAGNGRAHRIKGDNVFLPPDPDSDDLTLKPTNLYFLTPKGKRKYLTTDQKDRYLTDPIFQKYYAKLEREVLTDGTI